jgi:hypothetical protein
MERRMSSSSRSLGAPPRCDPTVLAHFKRWDAHPFQAAGEDGGGGSCTLCGEHRMQIRHHPTRVRASCLLKGLDPELVLGPSRR